MTVSSNRFADSVSHSAEISGAEEVIVFDLCPVFSHKAKNWIWIEEERNLEWTESL